jgi:hypothetical protein
MEHDEEIEAQVARVTRLLDEAAHRTRRSRRSLERELGLAHGYLGGLFRGRMDLKVYHVLLLAKLLHLDPVEILRQALQPEEGPTGQPAPGAPKGTEAGTAGVPAAKSPEAEERTPAMDLDRLQELIRQTFRDEVRKLGGSLAKMSEEP